MTAKSSSLAVPWTTGSFLSALGSSLRSRIRFTGGVASRFLEANGRSRRSPARTWTHGRRAEPLGVGRHLATRGWARGRLTESSGPYVPASSLDLDQRRVHHAGVESVAGEPELVPEQPANEASNATPRRDLERESRELRHHGVDADEPIDVDDLSLDEPSVVGLQPNVPPALAADDPAPSATPSAHDAERGKPRAPEEDRRRGSEGRCELGVSLPQRRPRRDGDRTAHEYIPATSVSFVCGSCLRIAPTITV